jgi:hypothetical protein
MKYDNAVRDAPRCSEANFAHPRSACPSLIVELPPSIVLTAQARVHCRFFSRNILEALLHLDRSPHPSPLPKGEGTGRSTFFPLSLTSILPPLSLWERGRGVRALRQVQPGVESRVANPKQPPSAPINVPRKFKSGPYPPCCCSACSMYPATCAASVRVLIGLEM